MDVLAVPTAFLQLLAVIFLMFGPARKYALVLGYCLLQLGMSVAEYSLSRYFGGGSKAFRTMFWTDEIVLDLLVFLILIVLTYRAMDGSPTQGPMRRVLGGITLLMVVLPFVLFKGGPRSSAWLFHTSQLLNFGGGIVNLGLWTALLGSRKKDRQLLTVSMAFGMVATGAAISFGLPLLIHTHWVSVAKNIFFVTSHLTGSAILCWAFRPLRLFRNSADTKDGSGKTVGDASFAR